MEGVPGTAVPERPGCTSREDGESYPGGGRCLRSPCGGRKFPMARAHHLGGWRVLPWWRSVPMGGLRGTAVRNGLGPPVGGTCTPQ